MISTVLFLNAPLHAQQAPSLEGDNAVLSRPRPGLNPTGISVGGFDVFPSLEGSVAYDDNVYETRHDRVTSPILTASPGVVAQSTWGRNALDLDASGTFERFTSRPTENNNRYRLDADGRLDALDSFQLNASAHYFGSIEARGTAGDLFSAGEPIHFRNGGGTFGLTAALAKVHLTAAGEVDRIDYSNVRIGTADLSQSYRNRLYTAGRVSIAYSVSPSIQPFVQGSVEHEIYDQVDWLNSTDRVVLGGLDISLTKLLTGRVGVGYRWRDYQNPIYRDSRGLTYDVGLVWNPRTLLSVTLDAQKAIDESPDLVSSGIVRNQGSVGADYELLRNLLLHADVTYAVERYRGLDRTDHRTTANLGVTYLADQFARLRLRYDLARQNGDGAFSRSYRGNVVSLALTLQR